MTVRVKVCGITNVDDALLAAEAGADALGFIFVEGTPRYVTPARAAAIIAALPPFACPVGVFWDHPPAQVRAVAEECGLQALQLHGTEPPEMVAAFRLPVLKTVKVAGPADLALLARYKPAAFLLDSPARWSEGEARRPISWTLAREAGQRGRIILSAGLTADTVGEAIRLARPFGVDVNSGVEAAPGRKDPEKVRRFVRAARAAALEASDG
ncbi:MAG TPA: phosphoribosylanthranilate isomerase [Candidatus Binatia bacterium]|jgi:phosphoribosylanthranilate isomerase|nr:phosphoribosylanthranilate isomerase [Methylomirabilota bacterium]